MSAKSTAVDRLAHEFAGDVLGANPTREELITMALVELLEENLILRQ
jgi:hypothetical protein